MFERNSRGVRSSCVFQKKYPNILPPSTIHITSSPSHSCCPRSPRFHRHGSPRRRSPSSANSARPAAPSPPSRSRLHAQREERQLAVSKRDDHIGGHSPKNIPKRKDLPFFYTTGGGMWVVVSPLLPITSMYSE